MNLGLADRRAIVTGGSRGIGFAVARLLAAEGVSVALAARNRSALDAAVAAIVSTGGTAAAFPVDTRSDESVRRMVSDVAAQVGGVEILINAAARPGGGPTHRLPDLSDDAVREELEWKVLGYLRCIRAVAPYMREAGWGRVVNVGGISAYKSGDVVGSIRNVAVAAMTKNLADELGRHSIGVVGVHPGATETEGRNEALRLRAEQADRNGSPVVHDIPTAAGHVLSADDIASVIVFLASPRSAAINGDMVTAAGGINGIIRYG